MMKALAIRHVLAEHLGVMEPILKGMGFEVDYLDTAKGEVLSRPLEEYALLVVLGGYMGAYEEHIYPFLSYEFRILEEALKLEVPVVGICLGCQMLAKALGSKVYRGEKGKEIGWMEVCKVGEHPLFEDFPKSLRVFQWHGDTFDLPVGAIRIYASEKYENQAFVYGQAVGLQFHIEVDKSMVEEWARLYWDELEKEGIEEEALAWKEEYSINFTLLGNLLKRLT